MLGIPLTVWYLLALIAFVAVLFVLFKRPLYEVMALSFVFTVVITGQYDLFWSSLIYPSTDSLFYAIFAFLVLATVFDETGVIQRVINVILALLGRFRGGAGYISLCASTFMASLSGTGPGNVAASGVFTIPAMKKTGFPPSLAATTEMSSSMLGNIIPPSAIVLLTYGILEELQPGSISLSGWILAAYAIGFWFFLQRLVTLWGFCRYYGVTPVPPEDRPGVGNSLRSGWTALILPILIFLPFFADAQFGDWIASRIGEAGHEAFSTSVVAFTPGMAAVYALWIGRRALEGLSLNHLSSLFANSLTRVVPVGVTIYMAYAIAQIFANLEAEESIRNWIVSFDLSTTLLIVVLPLFFMVLGMVLPGSAQVAILGGAVIGAVAALGSNPVLFAAMLPAMTGALEGMTPPLALGMFVAMGIADSGFKDTTKLTVIWVVGHVLLSMILLTGVLPLPGV